MSPDKLEKYILDHREDFDNMEPDPAVWERVDTRKSPIIRINWKDIAWKAAAVAVIFTASYFFHDFMAARKQEKQLSAMNNTEASPMAKELIEAEAYYSAQINMKKDELFILAAHNPDIRHEIDLEMVDLDHVYKELKEDLKDNAANEEVIEAMIQNYRLKLEILEDMLLVLKQSDETQNEQGHENAVEL